MQNWMPPNSNTLWQGAQGSPQQPWTGNQFGSMPMGNQPGMTPGSPTQSYPNMPPMTAGGTGGGTAGPRLGAPPGMGIDGPGGMIGLLGGHSAPPQTPYSSMLPGGSNFHPANGGSSASGGTWGAPGTNGSASGWQPSAPQQPQIDHTPLPHGFHINQYSGSSPLGTGPTTQHAPHSFPNFGGPPDTMSMGGRGGTGPIPAQTPGIQPAPPSPLAGPQAPTLGQSPDTGYAGGGSSGYLDGSGNNGGSTPFQLAGTGPTITPQYAQQIQAEHAADPSFNRNNSLANFTSPFTGIAQNQGGLSRGLAGSMPGLAGANSFAPQATAASYRPITGYGNQGSGGARV